MSTDNNKDRNTAALPARCPRCGSPGAPHLCDLCADDVAAQDAAERWQERLVATFPRGLWRAPDGSPWRQGVPALPPRGLVELAREERLLDAPEVCAAASDWLGGGKRTAVIRGCVGALKTTLAAAIVLEHLHLGGQGWIVRAEDLSRHPDDPSDPTIAATGRAHARAHQISALVVLDDLGAELGDGFGASRRVEGPRRIVQHRAHHGARTIVTTSIGDDCDEADFVRLVAERYEMDIARRLADPALSTVIHVRRKEG